LAGEGGGINPDTLEREIQKLIDSWCKRLPNGQGIVRPDGVVQVIDLRPDAPGWVRFRLTRFAQSTSFLGFPQL